MYLQCYRYKVLLKLLCVTISTFICLTYNNPTKKTSAAKCILYWK